MTATSKTNTIELNLRHTLTCDTDYETVWACCFLPAKTHSVLSCHVSLAHLVQVFQCFFFSHIITTSTILSPCLALVGQDRGERSADRGLFMLRLWLSSQSICLTGQEVSDCCRSFLSTESVTCPLAEEEKPANTQWPIRL